LFRREIAQELEKFSPLRFPEGFMQNKVNVSGSTFYSKREAVPELPVFDERCAAQSKVLILSVEPDMRNLLKTLIELWGFETTVSDCLENSLSIVENEQPCLILLDSVLPFEEHLENIRQLRRRKSSKKIPIIVLSGFSQPQFKNLSLAVGADGFLVKPIDFDLLETFLRTNIESRPGKRN
jgi:CheY-like chemotaxis protein